MAARSKADCLMECGFESRRGHGFVSRESVVCCQVEVSTSGRMLVPRSPTEGENEEALAHWGSLRNGMHEVLFTKCHSGK